MIQEKKASRIGQWLRRGMLSVARLVIWVRRDWHRAITFASLTATVFIIGGIVTRAGAETHPGGTDNGLTSRIVSLSDSLTTLGYGSTTDTPDWGAMWNRIKTSANWVPSGNVAASDVQSGKTFYNGSRTQQTGSAVSGVPPCPTQQYHDGYGAPVTQTTNCTDGIAWTTPSPVVTGDDKKDSTSGLVWSKYLANSSGTVAFVDSGGSTWTWNNTGANNVAVGTKTASQLCTERGNGWRLPTQKELLQAYIDGAYFNLTNPANAFWSATQVSSASAWYVYFNTGNTNNSSFGTAINVRCVR